MSLNGFEKLFIKRWKTFDFSPWNEADVREQFISPLLNILGYSKNTINDILREESLELAEPYHYIGRKRIKIDYIPTVRLSRFWIIEAKPGNPREMNFGNYLQAHLYAIHPEIQALFIVLSNGWEIRVYDAITGKTWDDFIIKCTQEDCEYTFKELRELLGSKQILRSVRSYILSTLKKSLDVEIDEIQVDELKREMNRLVSEARPKIKENVRQLRISAWKEAEKKEIKELRQVDISKLFIFMDNPIDARLKYGEECVRRIIVASEKQRGEIIDKIAMNYRGLNHAIFKVQCVYVLCRLIEEDIDVTKSLYVNSVSDSLEELVKLNLSYWSRHPIINALCHLDNTCLRLSKKLCLRIAMEPLAKVIKAQKEILSAEDLLIKQPSVAMNMIVIMNLVSEVLWRHFNSKSSPDKIWEGIWHYEFVEEHIDKIPAPKYPDGDSDLLFFEYYGKGFDMLCVGTWDVINRCIKKIVSKELPDVVRGLASKDRNQIITEIPKPKTRPEIWEPKEKYLIDSLRF